MSSWLETAMKFGGSCWKPQLDFSDCRMAVRLAGTDKVRVRDRWSRMGISGVCGEVRVKGAN